MSLEQEIQLITANRLKGVFPHTSTFMQWLIVNNYDCLYKQATPVFARQLTETENLQTAWGIALTGKSGDYEITSLQGDKWYVTNSFDYPIFDLSYQSIHFACPDPNSRSVLKTAPVWIKRIDADIVVHSLEGPATGKPGDWLAVGVVGEVWVLSPKARNAYLSHCDVESGYAHYGVTLPSLPVAF